MKFIAIAGLTLALMGCEYKPPGLASFNHAVDSFMSICAPSSISVTIQQNEDQAMVAATCSKAK